MTKVLNYFAFASGVITMLIGATVFAQGADSDYAPKVRERHAKVCARGTKDDAQCHAHVVVETAGAPKSASAPSGYGPSHFHGAYTSTTAAPSKQIIAVVDAYNHPNILSDLNTYSSTFGIPSLPACSGPVLSSPVPCFQKVNQRGGTSYPQTNAGWALEIALDVEVAHAMCQNCSILLVEADSNSYANLLTAFDKAIALGATVVSNSYGSPEFSGESGFDSHFNHPGVAITFSSGDSGYVPEYPAASPYVTAVGGTSLFLNADKSYNSESAWSGAGSGCSVFEPKPSWQLDPLCAHRTIADVSADADPSTGAAVYDSVRYSGRRGWFQVGGTSLSSPLVAGIYALAGGVPASSYGNSLPYSSNPLNLHDIVSGSNGSCGGTYLCTGLPGYDGPTGLGTPAGLGAF